jgi:hypothetical protein
MEFVYDVHMWEKRTKTYSHTRKIIASSEKEANKAAERYDTDCFVDEIETCLEITYSDLLDVLNSMTDNELEMPVKVLNEKGKKLKHPTIGYNNKNEIVINVL